MPTVVEDIIVNAGAGSLTAPGPGGTAAASSWSDIHARARRMAAVLAADGLGRGSRIGLLAGTGTDLVTALQAVWLAGASVTVLPPARRVPNLAAVVADAGLHLVIADVAADLLGAAGARVMTLRTLGARADTARPIMPRAPGPADLAVLQYTSGSTRTPRGVPVTHGHLAANVAAIRTAVGCGPGRPDRMLSWLPLHHDMGLVGFLTLPMAGGHPLVLMSPDAFARRPATWLTALADHRITVSGAPTFAFGLAARLLPTIDVDLSAVRLLICGGEPVDPATMAAFAAAGRPCGLDPRAIMPAYGLAEATLAVTFAPCGTGVRTDDVDRHELETRGRATPARAATRQVRRLVRLGPPVAGTGVRIVDRRTGMPVMARVVGSVEVRGPSVVGHHRGRSALRDDGWLTTGDLGYLTEGGDLVVCGREKDVLFAAGRNVFPQDVEAAAAEVAGVRPGGVVAFGVAGRAGDRLVVAVESRGVDVTSVRRDVAAVVLDEVGLAPHAVVTVRPGSLPRTTSGKLRRAEIRRRYLCDELTPGRMR